MQIIQYDYPSFHSPTQYYCVDLHITAKVNSYQVLHLETPEVEEGGGTESNSQFISL